MVDAHHTAAMASWRCRSRAATCIGAMSKAARSCTRRCARRATDRHEHATLLATRTFRCCCGGHAAEPLGPGGRATGRERGADLGRGGQDRTAPRPVGPLFRQLRRGHRDGGKNGGRGSRRPGARGADRNCRRRSPEQRQSRRGDRPRLVHQPKSRCDHGCHRLVRGADRPGDRGHPAQDHLAERARSGAVDQRGLHPDFGPLRFRYALDRAYGRHRAGGPRRQDLVLHHGRLQLWLRPRKQYRRGRRAKRRRGAGPCPLPARCARFRVVSGAGAGIAGQGHRAGQCRLRSGRIRSSRPPGSA